MCREAVGSFEAEAARHAGEHVEDDNGREVDAVNEALKEVWHVGVARAKSRRRRRRGGPGDSAVEDDEEVGDVQRPERRKGVAESVARRLGEAPERSVADSGWVEPASRGVHQEVQRRDEAAEAGVAEAVPGHDGPWSPLG